MEEVAFCGCRVAEMNHLYLLWMRGGVGRRCTRQPVVAACWNVARYWVLGDRCVSNSTPREVLEANCKCVDPYWRLRPSDKNSTFKMMFRSLTSYWTQPAVCAEAGPLINVQHAARFLLNLMHLVVRRLHLPGVFNVSTQWMWADGRLLCVWRSEWCQRLVM